MFTNYTRRALCLLALASAVVALPIIGCGGGGTTTEEPEPVIEMEELGEDQGTALDDPDGSRARLKIPYLYSYNAPRSGSTFKKGQRFSVSGYIRNSGQPAVGLPILLVIRDWTTQNELIPPIVCPTDAQGRFSGTVTVDFGKNTKGKKFTLTPEFRGNAEWRANIWTSARRTYTVKK